METAPVCGIAGYTRFNQTWGDETLLKRMGDAIAHRGPDASGIFLDESVGLCHRRLSIIDLSEAGNQPFIDDTHGLVVVFNGEIYNFLSLRSDLAKKGYIFKSLTDTEVILAAYHIYGEACVNHLNGMFAFALWDKNKNTLFMARDRLGKKPLYYSIRNQDVVFASELKALIHTRLIDKTIRNDAVMDFFMYQYIPDPKTIFEGVFKLEPGHCLAVSTEGVRHWQYWDVDFSDSSPLSFEDATQHLKGLIEQSTKDRMLSDVPIGAFLSGGVDSSGIVACMATSSDRPVTTCSIGFDERAFNETEFAQMVAAQYKTDHHQYSASNEVEKTLLQALEYFDEPFADPSLVPTFLVCELAKKSVTVALAGDGGDEIFAGYQKYVTDDKEQHLRSTLPDSLRHGVMTRLASACERVAWLPMVRLSNVLTSLSANPAQGFFITNAQIHQRDWSAVVDGQFKIDLGGYDPAKTTLDTYAVCSSDDHLSKILYTDLKTYLPGNILVKVDRMSMAHSLEVRAPLLDYRIVEFAATLPSRFKYEKGDKKRILKNVFEPMLPPAILHRKKMGFSPPLATWMRQDLKALFERTVLGSQAAISQFFNMVNVNRLWKEHLDEKRNHAQLLWSILVFELWWGRYMVDRK